MQQSPVCVPFAVRAAHARLITGQHQPIALCTFSININTLLPYSYSGDLRCSNCVCQPSSRAARGGLLASFRSNVSVANTHLIGSNNAYLTFALGWPICQIPIRRPLFVCMYMTAVALGSTSTSQMHAATYNMSLNIKQHFPHLIPNTLLVSETTQRPI